MGSKIITEYKQSAEKKNDEVDLLQGRMLYSILDKIAYMQECEMSEEEIRESILREVENALNLEFQPCD
jgi:hypothetical protein